MTSLASLDINVLTVRQIIPLKAPGDIPYAINNMLVTDSNGFLKPITLQQYFSTFGYLDPSTIMPYIQDALVSTTYGYTISSVSTIAYVTNSTIINSLIPSTNAFLYSTVTSTTLAEVLNINANFSSLSSYIYYNNPAPGVSSLSTNLATLSNISLRSFSTLSTTISQTNLSTISTFSSILYYGLFVVNSAPGLSTISTSMSDNFSSFSTAISSNSGTVAGICSLSTIVYVGFSTMSAGLGVSSLSTQTGRSFIRFNSAPGLSSLSTVVSLSISSYSTIIGRNPPGTTGISSLSTGTARQFIIYNSAPGLSSLSTNMVNFFSSFSTAIYSDPPGITGVSSLYIEMQNGLSSIACSDGLSSLSTTVSLGLSSVFGGLGLSSLSTTISRGLSSVACSLGLSSLSTSISLGLSSVATSVVLSNVSTSLSFSLSTVACSEGLSSLSTSISLGLSSIAAGDGLSSLSSYVHTLSTVDIQYNGIFDYISGPRFLHRVTDKPSLGLNCIPDFFATLDVNGMTHFQSTVYLTNSKMGINIPYNTDLNSELDVSGTILANNIYTTGSAVFGTTVTAQEFLTPSDSRLKDKISSIQNALSTLKMLRGVRFQWLDSLKNDIGLIAQEVQGVIPEVVQNHSRDPYLVVAYEKLIPILIESVKELFDKVEVLEAIVHGSKK